MATYEQPAHKSMELYNIIKLVVRALRDKNRSRANCVPIYGDLYQNLQWSLTFNLKVVTHLKSASEASCDVINMATIIRKKKHFR